MKRIMLVLLLVFAALSMSCDNTFHDLIEENTDNPEQISNNGNDETDDAETNQDETEEPEETVPEPEAVYRITYFSNGGSGDVPIDTTEYHSGDTVTVADNSGSLNRSGHQFIGWNTDSDGTGEWYVHNDTLTIGDSNIDLYALWADHYVYVVSTNSSIERFAINADNYIHRMDSISGSFTSLGINTHTKYIYTWDSPNTTISSYSIGSDGALTHESSTGSINGITNMAMTHNATGPDFIFMAYRPGGTGYISRTSVNGDTITSLGNTHTSNLFWNIRPFLHSSQDVLYMQHKSPLYYSVHSHDNNGDVSYQSRVAIDGSCYGKNVVMNPSGTKLYIAGSDGVHHMDVAPNGDLSNDETVPTSWTPLDIAIHPSEDWLYLSGNDGNIYRFELVSGDPQAPAAYSSAAGVSNINVISSDLVITTSVIDSRVEVWTINTSDGSLSKKDEISCTSPSSFVFYDI